MADIILYHGTDILTATGDGDIVGLVDTRYPEISGNLTDDILYAKRWALRRGYNNPEYARVIVFSFNEGDITDMGPIDGNDNTHGYATKFKLQPDEIPKGYLEERMIRPGTLEILDPIIVYCYRAPRSHVIEVLPV